MPKGRDIARAMGRRRPRASYRGNRFGAPHSASGTLRRRHQMHPDTGRKLNQYAIGGSGERVKRGVRRIGLRG